MPDPFDEGPDTWVYNRKSTPGRMCVDCAGAGRPLTRAAPYPGPRCATDHRLQRAKGRFRNRDQRIQETYQLTPEDYQAMLDAQDGRCYVCRRRPGKKKLSVDHDHSCCHGSTSCGKCVRGLLCNPCNRYLGHILDDPAAGRRIMVYLTDKPGQVVLGRRRV